MKGTDVVKEYMDELGKRWFDNLDHHVFGYREGKHGWIKPTYKGKGRPKKEDYEPYD